MTGTPAVAARTSAVPVVRRIVVYTILFVLVILVASGLADLLGRLGELAVGAPVAGSDTGGLAVSLTFTLVGGPLASLLAWFAWRRLADPPERASLAWALYLVGIVTVAVVIAGAALLTAGAGAIAGDDVTGAVATGVVWALVWAAHRAVLRGSSRRPSRLPGTAAVLGGTFGLVLGSAGSVTALTILLDTAVSGTDTVAGEPWWLGALQALVWAAGGTLLWWWHWQRDDGRSASTALSAVVLVGVGILGGALLALIGVGTVVFVLLRLAVDRSDPLGELVDPLGPAIAAAAVGSVVWAYHRDVVRRRRLPVRQASALVTSGLALAVTATGIGVVVNALLAGLTPPLAAQDPQTLLLGGLSSILVGGPLWWATWRPASALTPERRHATGRGVYLVVLFGISALVALSALLVIGFRLFDSVLAGDSGLLDAIRAPLGLLVATALVAGYHFGVWRSDRAAAASAAQAPGPQTPPPAIRELVLIMGPGGEPVVTRLRRLTGAEVAYWRRTGPAGGTPSSDQVADVLAGVTGDRVVLLVGADGTVTALPVTAVPVTG